jgi:hypothetical protein
MSRLRAFVAKLRGVVTAGRSRREFDQEVGAHLDLLTEKYVRDGMTAPEARDAALRQFGNVASLQEAHGEMRTFAGAAAFAHDVRYGARLLWKSPGWTIVAVLTFTLGIGANIAIFSLIRPILLEPLPYPDPARLVVPCTIFQRFNTDRGSVAFADILDWKAQADLFETVAAFNPSSVDITDGEEPERVPAVLVDDMYFRVMGTPPLLGRFFTAEENLRKGPPVVVLGHDLWMRRYGSDPGVIGRRIEIRGVANTIVGVARE